MRKFILLPITILGFTLFNISFGPSNIYTNEESHSDDNESNTSATTISQPVSLNNLRFTYSNSAESSISTDELETEANNSSIDKVYSLNWERDEYRSWKLKFRDYSYVQNGWYYLGKDGYMVGSTDADNTGTSAEMMGDTTDQTEGQLYGSGDSTLAFSNDFSINYKQETDELDIIGNISSNCRLKDIRFTYCTPYEIFSDRIPFEDDVITCFDLYDLSYLIEDIAYSRREHIDGDYILIITATDYSGNSISGGLLWVFKDDQLFPFELG